MSVSPSKTSEELIGSRAWLEDDKNTTLEAEQRHWLEVKKGSDEMLDRIWNSYGKWGTNTFKPIVAMFMDFESLIWTISNLRIGRFFMLLLDQFQKRITPLLPLVCSLVVLLAIRENNLKI